MQTLGHLVDLMYCRLCVVNSAGLQGELLYDVHVLQDASLVGNHRRILALPPPPSL